MAKLVLSLGCSSLLYSGAIFSAALQMDGSEPFETLIDFDDAGDSDKLPLGQLVWNEEFDSFDTKTWGFDLGGNGQFGEEELQVYTSSPDNVRVEDGLLKIITRKEQAPDENVPTFTSGRIKTLDSLSFTYGTIEARMKVPDMDAGLSPAFRTLGTSAEEIGWPQCGEITALEMGEGTVSFRRCWVDTLSMKVDNAPAFLTQSAHLPTSIYFRPLCSDL
jgi:beta-glucanase (GH16 family)